MQLGFKAEEGETCAGVEEKQGKQAKARKTSKNKETLAGNCYRDLIIEMFSIYQTWGIHCQT